MSTTKFFAIGTALLISISLACSVNSDKDNLEDRLTLELEDRLTLENVKSIHRVAMENVMHEFSPQDEIKSLESKIDYVSQFNIKSIKDANLDENLYKQLSHYMEINKGYVYEFKYESVKTKQTIISSDPFVVQELAIKDIEASELFHKDEIHLIKRMGNLFNASIYSPSMTDSIALYKSEYLTMNYSSPESYFQTGIILAIAEESHSWWNDNLGAAWGNPKLNFSEGVTSQAILPGPIATDVAGAIIGGAVTLGGQVIFNDDVNWAIVGYGAVAGAVIGSTGAVGRLARWLAKL